MSFVVLPEIWYNGVVYVKGWMWIGIVASLLVSGIIYNIFSDVKDVQKWVVRVFAIRVPVFIFAIVYAYSFLYRMLNMDSVSVVLPEEFFTGADALTFSQMWYNGSVHIKRWVPVVIVASPLIGWIVYDIFKEVAEVRKWVFNILITKLPIFTFILMYVYAAVFRFIK